jgi:hypothetical protein
MDQRRGVSVRWVGLAAWLLAAASARAATTILVPIRDNTIYAESGASSNGAGAHFFAGRNGLNQTRRGLLAFDLSSIPAGSTVDGVSLVMYCSKATAGSSAQTISLYRLLKSWGEAGSHAPGEEGDGGPALTGDVTWTHRFSATIMTWATPGGEFAASVSASTLVGGAGFFYTWSSAALVADVQGWLDSPATNHGWIVRGNETSPATARRFGSRQNGFDGFWPHLTVSFTPPPSSPGATPDGDDVPGQPLTVARIGPDDFQLSWGPSCAASAHDYAVYQGTIGAFGDMESLTCTTEDALTYTPSPAGGSVFWLIVPVDEAGNAEGSYGTRSDDSERPPAARPCFPQGSGPACR